MNTKQQFLLLICILLPLFSFCQNENNNWIVGDYQLVFNDDSLFFNQLPEKNFSVWRTTSISDKSGDLLFYTNGQTLYTKDFKPALNGHFINSYARPPALFLPDISDSNLSYLFSSDGRYLFQLPHKLYYSVLDSQLNDGKGDVIQGEKNILLNDNITPYIVGATGLCESLWLITQESNTNRFFSYELTAKGIKDPVISNVDPLILSNGYGVLKTSPNSKYVALFDALQEKINLFHFDNVSGKIDGGIKLPLSITGLGNFSGAFSPDGTKLYVFVTQLSNNGEIGEIYQFDISIFEENAINQSKYLVSSLNKIVSNITEIQLAPNGMILLERIGTEGTFLSAIENPNLTGMACNFIDTIFSAVPPLSIHRGLQNLIPSISYGTQIDSLLLPQDTQLCQNLQLPLQIQAEGDTYRWQDGSTSKDYEITSPGTYWVEVQKGNCTFTDTLKVLPDDSFVALGADTTICQNESIIINISPQIGQTYQWQDGSINLDYTISEAGLYWVESKDSLCSFRDSITVEVEKIVTNLPADTFICLNEIIALNLENSNIAYEWQDGNTLASYSILAPGIYWVEAQKGSCQIRDTITVSQGGRSNFLPNDTTLCNVSEFIIKPEGAFEGIAWFQHPALADSLLVTESGLYRAIIIEEEGCNDEDSISVTFTNLSLALPADTTICDADDFLIDLENLTGNLTWQDGSTNQTFLVTESGNYWATLSEGECQVSDSILVSIKPRSTIDLGKDTLLCLDENLTLFAPTMLTNFQWQDGTTNNTQTVTQSDIYWIAGQIDNCPVQDSITVTFEDCPEDTSPCQAYLPNSFSPNGDGNNDELQLLTDCELQFFEMEVYDRWGNLLFSSSDIRKTWNGKYKGEFLETGVYLWVVRYQFLEDDFPIEKTETITVIK